MNTKTLLMLILTAVVAGDSRESRKYGHTRSVVPSEARYDFSWAVNHADSGNDFGHQEARDGDNTQGSYYVQLPDGRRQTVTYYVDGDDGYIADVQYSGEARYPDSYERLEAPHSRVGSVPRSTTHSRSSPVHQATRATAIPTSTPARSRVVHIDSLESQERFRFPSFERFDSLEDLRAFNVPRNPFLPVSN